MATNKHFLQDRTMLLFVSAETFLTLLTTVLILLRLNAMRDKVTYMAQFRSLPNAPDFITGGVGVNGTVWDIVAFIVAACTVYGIGMVLAFRAYKLRRELSLTVLVLTFVLLMFLLAVSNILLVIRS